jgi:hypothetical protein
VFVDGQAVAEVPCTPTSSPAAPVVTPAFTTSWPRDELVHVPLGRVAGARSGDKAGRANVGVWVESDAAYAWLAATLSVDWLRTLVPEAATLSLHRFELPNLRALNFVVDGLLGRGVGDSTRYDPQAKSLGEYLRAQHVDVPRALLR